MTPEPTASRGRNDCVKPYGPARAPRNRHASGLEPNRGVVDAARRPHYPPIGNALEELAPGLGQRSVVGVSRIGRGGLVVGEIPVAIVEDEQSSGPPVVDRPQRASIAKLPVDDGEVEAPLRVGIDRADVGAVSVGEADRLGHMAILEIDVLQPIRTKHFEDLLEPTRVVFDAVNLAAAPREPDRGTPATPLEPDVLRLE